MSNDNDLSNSFYELLNRHGYSFQYSILKIINEASKITGAPWIFEVAEYPILN